MPLQNENCCVLTSSCISPNDEVNGTRLRVLPLFLQPAKNFLFNSLVYTPKVSRKSEDLVSLKVSSQLVNQEVLSFRELPFKFPSEA